MAQNGAPRPQIAVTILLISATSTSCLASRQCFRPDPNPDHALDPDPPVTCGVSDPGNDQDQDQMMVACSPIGLEKRNVPLRNLVISNRWRRGSGNGGFPFRARPPVRRFL